MKKIKQTSSWALLLMVAIGCKKEAEPQMSANRQTSTSEQIASLIQKGDPEAYNMIYGDLRTAKPRTHVHHGIFHWPSGGGPEDGTCIWNPNCVCMICLEAPALVDDSTPVDEITTDFHGEWTDPGDAELLINDEYGTTIHNLQSIDITFDVNGDSKLAYKVIE